jgi:deoxyribonuclease-4
VNLASVSDDIYEKSIHNLSAHLKITDMIGADGLIFHLGSSKGISKEEGLEREVEGIKRILKQIPGESRLIMENSAGGGDKIGSDIKEMAHLFHKVNSPRLKICFDTAHAFEAGILKEYSKGEIKDFFGVWDKEIGLEHLVALHVNDSKTTYASHHDRHENIGEGHIGIKGFQALAGESRLWDKAWLLEVPGFTDEGPDKKNVEILKSLFE